MIINLAAEMEKLIQVKPVKTVLKMSEHVLLFVGTEKENQLKIVQTAQKTFLSVLRTLAEMEESIQEKFVMIENKTEKIKDVLSLVLLPIHLLPSVEMAKLIQGRLVSLAKQTSKNSVLFLLTKISVEMGKLIKGKPVKTVLKISKDASLFAEMES